jgi:hypothetical protein
MFNRMLIAAAASLSMGQALAAPTAFSAAWVETVSPRPKRAKRVQRIGGGVCRKYRNRWKAARPKRRSNMNHVSRRTRRKHRRGRKAA